jgi:shikimate dehydrogenase
VLVPISVAPDGLAVVVAALRAMRALGASVTVPHKLAVAAHCDELSADAAAIGAVNCLQLADGKLIGHNTDSAGFIDGLTKAGFDATGKHVVLLGAGGAARAVAYGLRGASSIEIVARRPMDVGWAQAWQPLLPNTATATLVSRPWTGEVLSECFARAALVVDCTSAALDPELDVDFADSLPLGALAPAAWVTTLVYHRQTALLERASAANHSTLDGRAMLVHQGARAFTLWTGTPAPVEVMGRALDANLER